MVKIKTKWMGRLESSEGKSMAKIIRLMGNTNENK